MAFKSSCHSFCIIYKPPQRLHHHSISREREREMHRPPTSPSSSLHLLSLEKTDHLPMKATLSANDEDDFLSLHRWPSPSEVAKEMSAISRISGPTLLTGLFLYSRAMISMLFLGYLGELELAGGSLAIGFANITGYSVLSGLAMGMEPICGQAFGAQQWKLLGLTLQRTTLVLLSATLPISLLWLNMHRILLAAGQDAAISNTARTFVLFSLPDLVSLSFLHPLRIYLRSQNVTFPVTLCSAVAIVLHPPANFLLVGYLKLGVAGVALSSAWTNVNMVAFLLLYLRFSDVYRRTWVPMTRDCLRGWTPLLKLAVPTCVSVCLEWWWYEIMVLSCGLLPNPKATVASMGVLIQTTALVYVFPSALSLGVSTRVGNELGAGRPAGARAAGMVGMGCAGTLGVCAMGFAVGMRHRWGRLFTTDPEILRLTSIALPIVGLCELGNCPQTTGCGVLRGCARPTVGANINLGSFYCVGMPVAVVLGFAVGVGFPGLWLGLLAAQATCAVAMMWVLVRTDWPGQAERARELIGNNVAANIPNDGGGAVVVVEEEAERCKVVDVDGESQPLVRSV